MFISTNMKLTFVYFIVSLLTPVIYSDTTVTIYPEWLSSGGRSRYDSDRWNKHNGLDKEILIPRCRSIGTDSGRWINRDFNDNLFKDWPEDANRKGYPDPNYLKNTSKQEELFSTYRANIETGYHNSMVMMAGGHSWPSWINQSDHSGQFPNTFDAAAEIMMLMIQGIYDYTKGQIPPYFEPINEPDSLWKFMNLTTAACFHKVVADKLHSKFHINVSGPTLTSYSDRADYNNFKSWKDVSNFIDITINHLDIFSFHSYNSLIVSGKSHRFSGMNEARLVAFVDLVENYYKNKIGRVMPLSISEYGRGPVIGINDTAPSGIVDFATIYHSNAHRFTQLGLREYVDRSVAFLLANEKYPGHDSLNWSLFTMDGKATRIVDVYKYWYNLTTDYRFLRTSSRYDGKERVISPLVLSNPLKNETIVFLLNYSQKNQTVTLNFDSDWISPQTGEAICIILKDNWYPNMTYNTFNLAKSHGEINMLPEATCQFRFKTSFNPRTLATVNETTYYGADMVIPVDNDQSQTTITLPPAAFYTAKLRVSISLPVNMTKHKTKVTLNGQTLSSFFMLYDSDKHDSDTYWNVWEFPVSSNLLQAGANMVHVYFSNTKAGGYVSSVALVTGTIVPTEN